MSFIHGVGVPRDLVTDDAKEEKLGDWQTVINNFRIRQHQREPYS